MALRDALCDYLLVERVFVRGRLFDITVTVPDHFTMGDIQRLHTVANTL